MQLDMDWHDKGPLRKKPRSGFTTSEAAFIEHVCPSAVNSSLHDEVELLLASMPQYESATSSAAMDEIDELIEAAHSAVHSSRDLQYQLKPKALR